MSATPLLADVEDVASSAWEFAPPAIAEREPWDVNMELPGGGPPIWKSFHSTPGLFDLKLLIRDAIRDADTSMWEIFVDGDRLTNENTINMLQRKSATRTDGQVRCVVVTARRVQPAKCTLRWPTWLVLSLSLLMLCSLAFAMWYEQAYEELLDEGLGRQASSNTTNMNASRHQAFEEGRSRQAASDKVRMNATRHEAFEEGLQQGRSRQASSDIAQLQGTKRKAYEEGVKEGRSKQVASDTTEMNTIKLKAYKEGLKEGRSRQVASDTTEINSTKREAYEEGLKEGRSRQVASDTTEINTTKHEAYEEGLKEGRSGQALSDALKLNAAKHKARQEGLEEGRSRQASADATQLKSTEHQGLEEGLKEGKSRQTSIDMAKLNATRRQAFEAGVEEGRSRQEASDMTELNASKHIAHEQGLREGRSSQAETLHATKKEAYKGGLKEGKKLAEEISQAYERGLKEGKIASRAGTINTTTKENITDKGSQKAYDEGSPERVGDERLGVDWPWCIEIAAAVGSFLGCICIFLFVVVGSLEIWREADPRSAAWWVCIVILVASVAGLVALGSFSRVLITDLFQQAGARFFKPMLVASVAALVALGVMSCAMISDMFLQAKQQHSFSISLAACLTCMCQFWFIILDLLRGYKVLLMIICTVAAVGTLLSEAAWIHCAEDGQQLITIASASLLAVTVWLLSWGFTMRPMQDDKRRAAFVGLVLHTLFAGYFLAMCFPSRFTLEKESEPGHSTVMMVLCVPLSSGSVAMELLARSALLEASRQDDRVLLVRSLFFAPICIFTMLRLQEAWQWFAMTILTLATLFLTYVMRDWLKERCW